MAAAISAQARPRRRKLGSPVLENACATDGESAKCSDSNRIHQTKHPLQDAQRDRQTVFCHCFFSGAVLLAERRLISVRRWLALESRSRS